MNFYLTINEEPHGLFKSQIIDVISFLDKEFDSNLGLVCFISLRTYFKNRKIIKSFKLKTIVFPSIPKLYFFRWNIVLLIIACWIYRPKGIIARNVFACKLALKCKGLKLTSNVIYDGRGYLKAEAEEYSIYPINIKKQISDLENLSLKKSDYIMSITSQMIECWKKEYNYNKTNYVIIPNTIGENFINNNIYDNNNLRNKLGYNSEDLILIYSGSNARWQSLDNTINFCRKQLVLNGKIKVILLTKEIPIITKLIHDYPNRVSCKWINSGDVVKYMTICDYGLLMRNKSITNSVSFSTKFAEYLSCGLKIITTNNMAISKFVKDNDLGIIIQDINLNADIKSVSKQDKTYIREIAIKKFTKTSKNNYDNYKKIITLIKQ